MNTKSIAFVTLKICTEAKFVFYLQTEWYITDSMANIEPFFVEHWKLSHFFSSWEGWASNDYCKVPKIFKNRVNHGEKAKINFLPLFLPLKESKLLTEHCYEKPERPLDQHGGGKLEEEMHVVIAMGRYIRDFWTAKNVSETWQLMMLVLE